MLFIKIFQTGTGDQYCRANILSLLTIVIIFSLFDPFSQKWNVGLEEGKNKRSDGETRHLLRSVSLDSVTFKIWSYWWLFMVWGLIGVALYLLELSLEVRYCKPVRLQTPSSTTSSTSPPPSSPSSSPSKITTTHPHPPGCQWGWYAHQQPTDQPPHSVPRGCRDIFPKLDQRAKKSK